MKEKLLASAALVLLACTPAMAQGLDEVKHKFASVSGDAARQNSPGECVITSGTSDCMRCKKIAKAGQVPAFFVSPVVVWGMAGLACAGA